jgi:outer membrane lipoprotein-sorting protein
LLAAAGVLAAQDATLEQLVAKNTESLGGEAALKAIETVTMTGKMVIQGGMMEAPLKIQSKRAGKMRTEMTLQGSQIVMAWDGKSGWMINPMMGATTPQPMDEATAASMRRNADNEGGVGSLASMVRSGAVIEIQGKQDVEGVAAYKLKVTRKEGGEPVTLFIGAETGLPVKSMMKVSQMGQDMEVESFPGDFKKAGGVLFAHSIDQKVGGRSFMKMAFEKIEVNLPLEDGLFKMPVPPPVPALKAEPKE